MYKETNQRRAVDHLQAHPVHQHQARRVLQLRLEVVNVAMGVDAADVLHQPIAKQVKPIAKVIAGENGVLEKSFQEIPHSWCEKNVVSFVMLIVCLPCTMRVVVATLDCNFGWCFTHCVKKQRKKP